MLIFIFNIALAKFKRILPKMDIILPKKEKSFLYGVLENVPLIDSKAFKDKVCEILLWTEKQWGHRFYAITPISNAEISLVTRLFLAYKEDRNLFFASNILDYNYEQQYLNNLK